MTRRACTHGIDGEVGQSDKRQKTKKSRPKPNPAQAPITGFFDALPAPPERSHMNWQPWKLAGWRRWATDVLMIVFLCGAILGAVVLAYFAKRGSF